LLVRSHTAGELVQRAEERGLLTRARDDEDHRRVHLALTER
jgi:DNA-binding MarR family transcriptional regulator